MKAIHRIIAALGLAFVLPAAADAATTDPEVVIYRFPGVRDNGAPDFSGIATVFHCTNFSGVQESIRFVTRNVNAGLVSNFAFLVGHLQSIPVSTHLTSAYSANSLTTGTVLAGTTAIAATSTNVVCTAMTIDAANSNPDGVALHAIRFNPAPGSQE